MPPLPRVTAAQVIQVLLRGGSVLSRSSGSHHIYIGPAGRRTTVPVHTGKILHPKVLRSIIDDAGWTVEQFVVLLAR